MLAQHSDSKFFIDMVGDDNADQGHYQCDNDTGDVGPGRCTGDNVPESLLYGIAIHDDFSGIHRDLTPSLMLGLLLSLSVLFKDFSHTLDITSYQSVFQHVVDINTDRSAVGGVPVFIALFLFHLSR
jgi:hypothetical protein